MCDYSLMHVASRSAKVEDVLVTSGFSNTISRGFSPVGEPDTACCVLPGTEIAFTKPVVARDEQGVYHQTDQTLARFRQINLETLHRHHDALELADGRIVMLHDLELGQTATVLQLPAAPKTPEESKAQERLAIIG